MSQASDIVTQAIANSADLLSRAESAATDLIAFAKYTDNFNITTGAVTSVGGGGFDPTNKYPDVGILQSTLNTLHFGDVPAVINAPDITYAIGPPPSAYDGAAPETDVGTAPTLADLPDIASFVGDYQPQFASPPDAPQVTLPDAPQFAEITIPDVPSVNLPVLSVVRPELDLPILNSPEISSYYGFSTETGRVYQSLTLDAVQAQLLSDIQTGGLGIAKPVQDAIFNEGTERDLLILNDAIAALEDEYSRKNFPSPPGALRKATEDLIGKFAASRSDTGRKIIASSAELAQKNTQFAVDSLLKSEEMHIHFATAFADRMLSVAKATTDAAISYFNVQVGRFNAQLDLYKSDVAVYEAKLRGETQKLEVFKSGLEAAKLRGDLNLQQLSEYRERVAAVSVAYQLYSAQINNYSVQVGAEKTKLDFYRTKAEIAQAMVQVKGLEMNAFEAKVRGAQTEVSLYQAKIAAGNSKIEGFKAGVDAQAKQAELKIGIAREYNERYGQQVAAFKAQTESLTSRYAAQTSTYNAQLSGYAELMRATAESDRVSIAVANLQQGYWKANADMTIAKAQVLSAHILGVAHLQESATAGALGAYATMAQGAMSAVTAIAQVTSTT
jgi:hypothetical protein